MAAGKPGLPLISPNNSDSKGQDVVLADLDLVKSLLCITQNQTELKAHHVKLLAHFPQACPLGDVTPNFPLNY